MRSNVRGWYTTWCFSELRNSDYEMRWDRCAKSGVSRRQQRKHGRTILFVKFFIVSSLDWDKVTNEQHNDSSRENLLLRAFITMERSPCVLWVDFIIANKEELATKTGPVWGFEAGTLRSILIPNEIVTSSYEDSHDMRRSGTTVILWSSQRVRGANV